MQSAPMEESAATAIAVHKKTADFIFFEKVLCDCDPVAGKRYQILAGTETPIRG